MAYDVYAYDTDDFDAMMNARPIGQIQARHMIEAQAMLRQAIANGVYPPHAILLESE